MGPLVLLTADVLVGVGYGPGPLCRPRRKAAALALPYLDAVVRAGGQPILAPAVPSDAAMLLSRVDALVLTGGAFDIHPSLRANVDHLSLRDRAVSYQPTADS